MRTLLIIILLCVTAVAQAQDLIIPKQGEPITAYNVEVSGNFLFYTIEPQNDATILRISKEDILMVRRSDGTTLELVPQTIKGETQVIGTPQYPEIKEEDIHGNLLAKGNCVYIPTDSQYDYEQAGQKRLKDIIKQWGYWIVVDKPEQAHFILQFTTQTAGADMSFLLIRQRKEYTDYAYPIRKSSGVFVNYKCIGANGDYPRPSSENFDDNINNASIMAESLKRMLIGEKLSYYDKKFLNNLKKRYPYLFE